MRINTDRVVVGAVASDLRLEYTALGDAINLAARMEQTASPGAVQIADPLIGWLPRPLISNPSKIWQSRAEMSRCGLIGFWASKQYPAICVGYLV